METKSILSKEALCLNEIYLGKINKDTSREIYQCKLISSSSKPVMRNFYKVEINNKIYWANTVTGTLFNNNGKCMTSYLLWLNDVPVKIKKNIEKKKVRELAIAA